MPTISYYDPGDPDSIGDCEPYLFEWRDNGPPGVAAEYPTHSYVIYLPLVEATGATPEEMESAETCLMLTSPLYEPGSSCARPAMPNGLPVDSLWPAVRASDCVGCVRAGDHVPPP